MNVMAGSWLIASVYIDFTMQMSSAIVCMCGRRSLIQVPCWPQRRPGHIGATTGNLAWPEVMPVRRWLPFTEGGISWPWNLCERWFVVEQIDVGEAFGLEEAEDALGFGGEVGEASEPGRPRPRRGRRGRPELAVRATRERGGAEGAGGSAPRNVRRSSRWNCASAMRDGCMES